MTCLAWGLLVNAVNQTSATRRRRPTAARPRRRWRSDSESAPMPTRRYSHGHSRIHLCGDREPDPTPVGGGHPIMVVIRTVGAQDPQPARIGPPYGREGIGHELARPPGRSSCCPSGAGSQRSIGAIGALIVAINALSPLIPGVAVPDALLGVAIGRLDGVVNVDVGRLIDTTQHRSVPGQVA